MIKPTRTSGYCVDRLLVMFFTLHVVFAVFGCFCAFRYYIYADMQNIVFPAKNLFFSRLFIVIFAISTLLLVSFCSRLVSLLTDILVAVYSFFGVLSLLLVHKYCNVPVIPLSCSIFIYSLSLITICYFSSVSQKSAIVNLINSIKSFNKCKSSKLVLEIFAVAITCFLPYIFLAILRKVIFSWKEERYAAEIVKRIILWLSA